MKKWVSDNHMLNIDIKTHTCEDIVPNPFTCENLVSNYHRCEELGHNRPKTVKKWNRMQNAADLVCVYGGGGGGGGISSI